MYLVSPVLLVVTCLARALQELFDETVLPSFLGNFADVERAVLRVLNHQPRPYELGAVVQAYLSMIDVSWSYTEETLQTAAVLIYDM